MPNGTFRQEPEKRTPGTTEPKRFQEETGEALDKNLKQEKQESDLDETIDESFPASDPPSNTPVTGSTH
jgi:hypothetical protein